MFIGWVPKLSDIGHEHRVKISSSSLDDGAHETGLQCLVLSGEIKNNKKTPH